MEFSRRYRAAGVRWPFERTARTAASWKLSPHFITIGPPPVIHPPDAAGGPVGRFDERRPASSSLKSALQTPNSELKNIMAACDIGLVGLAVMGENLVLNMESRGYQVAGLDRKSTRLNSSHRT